jgi:hypothetical protein
MKRIRFTEKQIIAVLREHEAGAKTAGLARKHGVSVATLRLTSCGSCPWSLYAIVRLRRFRR